MKMHIEMTEKEVKATSPFLYLFNLPGALEASEWAGKYAADYSYPEKYMIGLSALYHKYQEAINSFVSGARAMIAGFKKLNEGFSEDLQKLVVDVTPEIEVKETRVFEDE